MFIASRKAFTLIELLVVIAIIAVLAVVVVLTLNPAGLLQESRDSNRLSDMATINSALGISLADNASEFLGSQNTVYPSIPDPVATSTAGDQCQGLGLPALPATFSWHCAASSTFRKTDGTGWVPVNFGQNTFGPPFAQLPVDPINATSSRLFYAYATDGQHYEVTSPFESAKYRFGGSGDQVSGDGGTLATLNERGSKLGLMPLDYGDPSLVDYWTFDEGTGTVVSDQGGSNASGSWIGSGTHWAPGKVGSFAGQFNGGTDYVNAPNKIVTSAFSVAMWINPTVLTAAYTQPLFYTETYAANGFRLGLDSVHRLWFWSSEDGGTVNMNSGTPLSTSTWYSVIAEYNGAQAGLYLNGVLVGTTSGNIFASSSSIVTIGFIGGYATWSGYIDDVRIYNRALSAAEAQALYNGGK